MHQSFNHINLSCKTAWVSGEWSLSALSCHVDHVHVNAVRAKARVLA